MCSLSASAGVPPADSFSGSCVEGVDAPGVPLRLLTDNGVALSPTRRGWSGQVVTHVTALRVIPITGKPYKPTTQGKNERFHQTLYRWLGTKPLADSVEELQDHVDEFDLIYNKRRSDHWLPGRITPQQARDATPIAQPPHSPEIPIEPVLPDTEGLAQTPIDPPEKTPPLQAQRMRGPLPEQGQRIHPITRNGTVNLRGGTFLVCHPLGRQQCPRHLGPGRNPLRR